MRIFLVLSLFSTSIFAQTLVEKLDSPEVPTEIQPSCIWNHEKARCFIQNKTSKPVSCELSISGKTFDGQSIDNTRQMIVQPNMIAYGEELVAKNGTILRTVKGFAVCV